MRAALGGPIGSRNTSQCSIRPRLALADPMELKKAPYTDPADPAREEGPLITALRFEGTTVNESTTLCNILQILSPESRRNNVSCVFGTWEHRHLHKNGRCSPTRFLFCESGWGDPLERTYGF